VINIDFSGIHMLESVIRTYREQGGDVYMVHVHTDVLEMMKSTVFYEDLGPDHVLEEDTALEYFFYKQLDPGICIYECDVRVFKECQNLPKRTLPIDLVPHAAIPINGVPMIPAAELWEQVRSESPPLVIDVREPREFRRGHVPNSQLLPLPKLLSEPVDLPHDKPIILTCRTGRRSARAASELHRQGYEDVFVLEGGIMAWEAAKLLEAVEPIWQRTTFPSEEAL
jgi:SulP family sulfate permease